MHIYIVGSGHMASALKTTLQEAKTSFSEWISTSEKKLPDSVLIHIGSGRQLEEALRWCGSTSTPLIQASTGQDNLLPKQPPCPLILAPNLALPIIRLFELLPQIGKAFQEENMAVEITESHQARKKTVAGTALEFAKILKTPPSSIRSVRQPTEQKALNIPEEFLDAHAYHWITFKSNGLKIQISTQIEGSQAYAAGALLVAKKLIEQRDKLQNLTYSVQEILAL